MRPEKADIVKDLAKDLKESSFILVTDYQHMEVGDFSELRKRLAAAGAEVHVVKNSFLKRAMADSGLTPSNGELTGQTAVVTGEKDVAPVAKILKTFATEFKKAMLKLGFIDRAQVATKEIEQLADLPPREVLQAQLLGLFMQPATRLVRLLNEPASAFARLLKAKGEKEGPPAAETPAA
jgi:large subunit ribosomal protein L10